MLGGCQSAWHAQVVSLWIWLSLRFDEEYFPSRDRAVSLSEKIIGHMSDGLERMFGPTAALVNPKVQKAAASKFVNWTNGAAKASDMLDFVAKGRPLRIHGMETSQAIAVGATS